nr:DUF4333 domain-containing protein [Saccharomonospora cyanea]
MRGVVGLWWVTVSVCAALALTACGGDGGARGGEDAPAAVTTESSEPLSISTSPSSSLSLTPVPKALDGDAVEEAVRAVLAGSYGIADVERVRCPRRPAVREGATFDCTAVIAGESQRIPIEILDDEGRYEVGLPV